MNPNGHEQRIAKIEANCVKLKEQIMQLEFQNKKDIVAAQKRIDAWEIKFREKLDFVIKLAGIPYEELENLDLKVQDSGRRMTIPRKRATRP